MNDAGGVGIDQCINASLIVEQGNVLLAVLEEVLCQDGRAVCVPAHAQVLCPKWLAGGILAHLYASCLDCLDKAAGKLLAPVGSIQADMNRPAASIVPVAIGACCIVMDRNHQDILRADFCADGIHPLATLPDTDVRFLRHDALCIIAEIPQMLNQSLCELTSPLVFPVLSVGAALALCVRAVPVVN